jgi:uncharacterized protein (DUF2235 family)
MVMSAVHRFIKDMYRGPDESRIWLFGLSRGAYTVRAVAGMINNCGITKKDWAGVLSTACVQDRVAKTVHSQQELADCVQLCTGR